MFSFNSSVRAACPRGALIDTACRQDLGDHVQRGNSRDNAQELADIAECLVPYRQDGSRIGGSEVDHLAVVPNPNVTAVGSVIAVQAAQQGRFAGAGGAGQHDALARADVEIDAWTVPAGAGRRADAG